MSNIIRSLIVRIGADLGNFDKKMKDMKKMLKKTGYQMEATGKQMTKTFTLPFTASALAVGKFTQIAMTYSDMLDKMAIRTQITTDELQKLEYVSGQLGVNFESVQKVTTQLSKALRQGADSELGRIFRELKVETKDANGELKDMSTIFFNSVQGLRNVNNATEQGAIAVKLFGRQAEELLPILRASDGEINGLVKQFDDLGLMVENDTIKKFVKLGDRLDTIKKQFRKIYIDIASTFLPIIEKMGNYIQNKIIPTIKKMTNWLGSLSEKTKTNIVIFTSLLAAFGPVLIVFGKFLKILGVLKIKFIIIAAVIAGFITILINLKKENEVVTTAINRLWESVKNMLNSLGIFWAKWGEQIKEKLKNLFKSLVLILETFINIFTDLFNAFGNALEGKWDKVMLNLAEGIVKFGELSNNIFIDVATGIMKIFDELEQRATDMTNKYKRNFNIGVGTIADFFTGDDTGYWKIFDDEKLKMGIWENWIDKLQKKKYNLEWSTGTKSQDIPLFESLKNWMDDLTSGWLDLEDTIVDSNTNIISSISSFVNSIRQQTSSFANFVGLFDNFQSETLSPRRLLRRLQAQTRAIGEWQKNIATLESRGISGELLQELRNMGVSQSGAIKGLTRMTDEQLNQYMGSYSQKMNIAGQEAYKTVAGQQKIDTMIESQINITITDSNIRSADDTERVAKEIVRKLKLAGVNI